MNATFKAANFEDQAIEEADCKDFPPIYKSSLFGDPKSFDADCAVVAEGIIRLAGLFDILLDSEYRLTSNNINVVETARILMVVIAGHAKELRKASENVVCAARQPAEATMEH